MNNLKKIEVNKFFNSKKRIRNLGEVYTDRKEINAMLNLIPENIYEKIDAKFLEPACGNGNFLEEIIKKKLYLIKKPNPISERKQGFGS